MVGSAIWKRWTVGASCLALFGLAVWILVSRYGIAPARVVQAPLSASPALQPPNSTPIDLLATNPAEAEEPASLRTETVDETSAENAGLLVDVVDCDQKPAAGVWIELGTLSAQSPREFDVLARVQTDERGRARFDPRATNRIAARGETTLSLRADVLTSPRPTTVLPPGFEMGKPARIQLPPTGAVLLELVDARGERVRSPALFKLLAYPAGSGRDEAQMLLSSGSSIASTQRWVSAPEGLARVEHVGLGLELRILVSMDDGEPTQWRLVAPGPAQAGNEVRIPVPGALWPSVVLCAVDPEGRALPRITLDAALRWKRPPTSGRAGSEREQVMRATTDDEGRARFAIRGSVAGGYTRTLSLVEVADLGSEAEHRRPRAAEIDLSWELGEGVDLGKVVLRELPPGPEDVLWVSGRVLDSHGEPVAHATVLASARETDATAAQRAAAHVAADQDGRFRITGEPVTGFVSVRAHARDYLPGFHEAVLPGAEILLELRQSARWQGRILLDSRIPPETILVDVGSGDSWVRARREAELFIASGLDAGPVELTVRTREGNWLIESFENESTSAEAAQPSSLDLRGRLALLRLRLYGTDGSPLERAFARITPEPWPEGGAWIHAGHLDLVVPSNATSITVRPTGYRAFEVEPLDHVQEIHLQSVE